MSRSERPYLRLVPQPPAIRHALEELIKNQEKRTSTEHPACEFVTIDDLLALARGEHRDARR